MSTLSHNDFVLYSSCIFSASFEELCKAAEAGGFSAVTMNPALYRRTKAAGLSDADMRSMLNDHGLVIDCLDPLLCWLPFENEEDLPEFTQGFQMSEDECYAMAEALESRSINLAQMSAVIPEDIATEALAALCERARAYNQIITLEYVGAFGIADAATALRIVEGTGCDNATLMMDSWHTFRGPTTDEQIAAVPGHRWGNFQINDAPLTPPSDYMTETFEGRLLPGEGDAPLVKWLRSLDKNGLTAPIGVEVLSNELNALPPIEVGRRCGEAIRKVVSQVKE